MLKDLADKLDKFIEEKQLEVGPDWEDNCYVIYGNSKGYKIKIEEDTEDTLKCLILVNYKNNLKVFHLKATSDKLYELLTEYMVENSTKSFWQKAKEFFK